MSSIVLFGPGRLGAALTMALQAAGHDIAAVYGRNHHSGGALQFQRLTGHEVLQLEDSLLPITQADLVLITVPDKAVSGVAQTLASTDVSWTGKVVAHTAGALSSDVLRPLAGRGAQIMSVHPLQTFANPALGRELFHGVYWSLEGSDSAVALGQSVVCDLGGHPIAIDKSQRAQYHAAAVLASNALVGLAFAAVDLMGIEDGLQALLPLMRGALKNLEDVGLPNALTGPVDRGDTATVMTHLQALKSNPTVLSLYRALGIAIAQVARRKGSLSEEQWQTFLSLFDPDRAR